MSGNKIILVLLIIGLSMVFSSCSSSKKMKKKCRDCPEFSQDIKLNNQLAQFHERV